MDALERVVLARRHQERQKRPTWQIGTLDGKTLPAGNARLPAARVAPRRLRHNPRERACDRRQSRVTRAQATRWPARFK